MNSTGDMEPLARKLLLDRPDHWDLPHEVYILRRGPLGAPEASRFPIPDALARQDASVILRGMREAVRAASAHDVPIGGTLAGAAVVFEGWAPPSNKVAETLRRHDAGGSLPRFADLPDRVEKRQVVIATTDGRLHLGDHERGADDIAFFSARHATGDPEPGERGNAVRGKVPDALVDFLNALTDHARENPA